MNFDLIKNSIFIDKLFLRVFVFISIFFINAFELSAQVNQIDPIKHSISLKGIRALDGSGIAIIEGNEARGTIHYMDRVPWQKNLISNPVELDITDDGMISLDRLQVGMLAYDTSTGKYYRYLGDSGSSHIGVNDSSDWEEVNVASTAITSLTLNTTNISTFTYIQGDHFDFTGLTASLSYSDGSVVSDIPLSNFGYYGLFLTEGDGTLVRGAVGDRCVYVGVDDYPDHMSGSSFNSIYGIESNPTNCIAVTVLAAPLWSIVPINNVVTYRDGIISRAATVDDVALLPDGGTIIWSLSGAPNWLSIGSDGVFVKSSSILAETGIYPITVTGVDSNGASLSTSCIIRVIDGTILTGPEWDLNIQPFDIYTDGVIDMDLNDHITGAVPGIKVSSWSVTSISSPILTGLSIDPITGVLSRTNELVATGDYIVRVTATDESGGVVTKDVTITVLTGGTPSWSIDPISDVVTYTDGSINRTASVVDLNELPVIGGGTGGVKWSLIGSNIPSWLNIDINTGVISKSAAAVTGTYSDIVVAGTDDVGGVVTTTLNIRVIDGTVSTGPEWGLSSISNITIYTDDVIDLNLNNNITGNVPSGFVSSWSVASNPTLEGLSVDSNTGVLTRTSNIANVGDYTVTVTAYDESGGIVESVFTVTIIEGTLDNPSWNLTADNFDFIFDEAISESNISIAGTVPGGNLLWEFTNSSALTGISFDSSTGLLARVADANTVVDSYDMSIEATDDYGGSRSVNFTVTATTSGIAPTFIDSRDGKEYKQVQIENQIWMAENLAYNALGSYVYDNNAANEALYGRLYTWSTVMDGSASSDAVPSGVQGICPSGWHLPSNAEWTVLNTYLATISTSVGKSMAATSGWNNSTVVDAVGNDQSSNNSSEFSALPGGSIHQYTGSINVGEVGNWWTSTAKDNRNAYYTIIRYNNSTFVSNLFQAKDNSLSVRCVKN